MSESMTFPRWLEAQMKRRDLNQSAVATYLRTSASTVSAWRRGATPNREAVGKLASLFGVEVAEIEALLAGRAPADSMAEPRDDDSGVLFFAEPVLQLARELHALDLDGYERWLEIGQLFLRTRQQSR